MAEAKKKKIDCTQRKKQEWLYLDGCHHAPKFGLKGQAEGSRASTYTEEEANEGVRRERRKKVGDGEGLG